MSDSSERPERGESEPATIEDGASGEDQTDEASLHLGRREFLIGVGGFAVGATGIFLATDSSESDKPSFVLRQGYLRYEVDSISADGMTVEQFYDYTDTFASPAEDIVAEDAASRLFIYDGPVDSSLVFLHGSRDVDHGGTAKFSFSGLSRSQGEWAVRDDPMSVSDDFEKWEGGNQQVKWEWGPNTSDGGAYWGVLDRNDFTISVTPNTLRGVDSWRFLSGEIGDLDRYDLSREKPVKIEPRRGRTVKRANVDIMPDADENEFDPYSDRTLTVAVEAPPDGVDESEWVDPDDLDPGNYSVNFGSKLYLAGENAAQPQRYERNGGTLYLEYKAKAANFTLDSAYGYLVTKTGERTFVRGRDTVQPGGFDNVDEEDAQLVVTDRNVDPEGDDTENLAEEYVEFENDGDEQLDLTGYTIRDGSGATFDVPDGFVLGANESFRLHTGTGADSGSDLYWGRGRAVWNNDGDTVVVIDSDARRVLEYSYPRQ